MLIFLECRIQGKHDMKRFHNRVVSSLMDWDVDDVASYFRVFRQGQIDLLWGKWNFGKHLLNFLRPNLHQRVDVGHWLCVWNCWRLFVFVNVSYWCDPWQYLFWVLLCLLDWMNLWVLSADILLSIVHHHQLNFRFVWLVQTRFILNKFMNLPKY